jgi:WD40 repeat protein
MFHPHDPERIPSVEREEGNRTLLTQTLPDVAHFVIYNHGNRISDARVSPCARLLALARDSSVVSCLDNAAGVPDGVALKGTSTIAWHSRPVLTTAFSADSRLIVSGGLDADIQVSHTEAFRQFAHFRFHIEPILSVAIDPRGEYFLAGAQDRMASMWSLRSPTCLRCFCGHTLPVARVAFSSDSSRIVTYSGDLSVRVWDIGTGAQMARFGCGSTSPMALAVSRKNKYIACGCTDGTVVLWGMPEGKIIWQSRICESVVTGLEFSEDGTLLYASTLDAHFTAWNLVNAEQPDVVMRAVASASTIDSIVVTNQNLVCTTGRSIRGLFI